MYSAIQNEVNNINNPDISNDESSNTLELEEAFSKLQDIKIDIENLDTNESNDSLTDDDFNKLKDLISEGNDIVEAYRNILPADLLNYTKKTIKQYEDELIGNILNSDNADEYRAGLEYIINNLSTIYKGEEISFKDLKARFDSQYN